MKEMQPNGERLTKQAQEGYSKGGDIFMEEKSDMPPNSQPANPEHTEKPELRASREADIETLKEDKGLPVEIRGVLEDISQQGRSPQEKSSMSEIAAALKKNLPKTSLFREPVVKVPDEVIPFMSEAQKITTEKSKEFSGSKAVNLNPVNLAGVTDPRLKQIGDRINVRIAKNLMDYREVERNIQDIENVLGSLSASSPDLAWAHNLYSELVDEAVIQRQSAGEVNWEVVKEQLLAATKAGDLKTIEDIVRKDYDFNERINVRDLVEVSLSKEAIDAGTYGYALEYVLETIINVADLNPLGTIPNPTFAQMENISRLIIGTLNLEKDTNKTFYRYLQQLQERRQLSHELYKSMSTRGAYQKYVGEHLKNDGFDYLENKIVGVSETQGLWEKVMARKVSKKKQILNQREFDEVHEEVKKLFKRNAKLDANGTSGRLRKKFEITIKVLNPATGKLEDKKETIERSLREWEIDRAATVGRSVAHVSGRAITYGTLGDLPESATGPDELWDSMNAEYVARITASMKAIAKRFLSGFTGSDVYIKKWVDNKIKIAKEKGQIYGDSKEKDPDKRRKEKTLYGQKMESWIYTDTGVPDLKSHGWRNRETQLKNERFAKIDVNADTITTIGSYLDKEWKKVEDKAAKLSNNGKNSQRLTKEESRYLYAELGRDPNLIESIYLKNKETVRVSKRDRMKNIVYSNNVRNTVLNQRLYLSALSREAHFMPTLKEEIWKKASEFLPSRIADFFPEKRESFLTSTGIKMSESDWEKLSDKLFMAEMDRTREQAELVEGNDFATEVTLSKYYVDNGITDPEKEYIDEIIKLGKSKSEMLSNMIFPQSAFLDDAPGFDWMNLGKETVGRLLVNDYEGYDTANNERNAVIANPSMRLMESAEHLKKAKDGYAIPIGVPDAQDRLEADVMTRYELYAMNTSSKCGMYSINRVLKHPTSLIEESNVDANISMDEKAISDDVDFLSQNSVVGNDRAKLDFFGQTESQRIKRKMKIRLREVWLRNLRLFAMIFPGVFGIEFLKMLAPDLIGGK